MRLLFLIALLSLTSCAADPDESTSDTAPAEDIGGFQFDTTFSADALQLDSSPELIADATPLWDTTPALDTPPAADTPEAPICAPGAWMCQDLLTPAECSEDGTTWIAQEPCPMGQTCHQATGQCGEEVCEPTEKVCADGKSWKQCHYDGSGWGEITDCPGESVCNAGICISPACLPRVMFLVDRSTSMNSHWESVQNSISDVIAQNPEIQFGLTVFPDKDGFFAGCSVGDDSPHVPLQEGAGPVIDDWFDHNDPAGATPLKSAMEWMSEHVSQVWGSDLEAAYLVLLSDGEDKCTCGQYDDEPMERAECVADKLVDITQDLTAQGVRTFVIGYAYSGPDIELDVIAENGGTEITEYIEAGNEETLTAAFGQVIDDVKWCL